MTPEEVQKAFALNTFSTLFVTQAAAPHMPHGGRIVNVGTVVSRINYLPGVGVYGASKAAQEHLTAAFAAEVSFVTCCCCGSGLLTGAGGYSLDRGRGLRSTRLRLVRR